MPVATEAPPTEQPVTKDGSWVGLRAGVAVNGRYELGERLGAGATACVYRAKDLRLRRDVAVKVLHPHLAADREVVERFRREACMGARLTDEHLASVYDFGHWAGTHFIAIEYVAGGSLASILREEAPIDASRAIDLGTQLLRAARCIHESGIVHRDLKPANAMIDSEGRLKVIDLGVAREDDSDLTTTGWILGTVRYASPEQAFGDAVTVRSDLYSIGVILYELLTGRPLFDATSAAALVLKHVHERPTPLAAIRPGIPSRLVSAVMRSLHKQPDDRFADATEFIAALEEV